MDRDELGFTVDSQLLGELGERLVTRNYIALSELVKNAYDADATKITIRFVNAKKGSKKLKNSEIHLIDDGHGMVFGHVKDYWMRIATPYKVREPVSPTFGRRKTGNKGIGRFACRKLAGRLLLETTGRIPNSKDLEWTRMEFDWGDFEPGTNLTEIPCRYQSRRLARGIIGLTLTLKDLTEPWTVGEFNLLRRQLLTLSVVKGTRVEGFKEDPGFDIKLDAPEFPKGAGVLVDQFMDAGWGKLEGRVDEDGTTSLKMQAKRIGSRDYVLREKFGLLKGIEFEISWIPRKKEYFRDTRTLTKGLAEITREQGGVRVYLDGFRIYPYGDPRNDWLGIDKDVARRRGPVDKVLTDVASALGVDPSRALLSHPQNRHLIGKIYIMSRPETAFSVKADREGFVTNAAFEQLVRCTRLALEWFTLHYNKFLLLHETEALRIAEKKLRERLGEVRAEKKSVRGISAPLVEKAMDVLSLEAERAQEGLTPAERTKSKERVEVAAEVIERSFTQAQTHLNVLRAVASTGALMFVYSHEIKALIARLDTHANTIKQIVKGLPKKQRDELEQFAHSLRETRDRFDQQVKLFGLLTEKTADLKRKRLPVRKNCREVVRGFGYLVEHYELNDIELDIPELLKTGPMLDAELFSVIVNLLSNAIKATISGLGKNVMIRARKEAGKTLISVMDDGIGLPSDFREEVFEPLTADPDGRLYEGLSKRVLYEDLDTLGRGSGLGLSIVRGIAETYGGKAEFVDAEDSWKTQVEVVLP